MRNILDRLATWFGNGSPSLLLGGAAVIGLTCVARGVGILEGAELRVLDVLMRRQPAEARDERITIVEFTEADIQALGSFPVPDTIIHQLLVDLRQYHPRVIGLDIYRDIPTVSQVQPDLQTARQAHQDLMALLRNAGNIIAIEKVLDPPVPAPPGVPQTHVGFADALLDEDGFVRRSILGAPSLATQAFRLSLTIQLAQRYLAAVGVELDNGIKDHTAMRFGDLELTNLQPNSGGYVNDDTGGNPVILINFRKHEQPFRRVSYGEFMAGEVSAEWFSDRIVLVGMTAVSTKDYLNSAAIASANPGLVPGVVVQAHAVSQIISAVLDGRPLLQPLATPWEYIAIVAAGLFGMGLIQCRRVIPVCIALFLGIGSLPFLAAYLLLPLGVWMPAFPIGLVYFINGGSAVIYRIYQREQTWKIRLDERQRIIEQSYNTIHNRPLQTLKQLRRNLSSEATRPSPQTLNEELKKIDEELRSIYEFMLQERMTLDSQTYITQHYAIDLNDPLHELLHQVYRSQMLELANYFTQVKIKMPDFCPLDTQHLSSVHKEGIIRFLEEALSNVAQHARGVTRITVICQRRNDRNVVRIADNGLHPEKNAIFLKRTGGRGTTQARTLAHRLGGEFVRYSPPSGGTVCELSWPVDPPSFWARCGYLFKRLTGAPAWKNKQI